MRRQLISAVLGVAFLVAGCDGVGTTCDTPGSTSECGSELICTITRSLEFDLTEIPVNVCLRLCDTSRDCGDGEVCRPVACTEDEFSCQTGPAFEFPDDVDPCEPPGTGDAAESDAE
ncbi:MAG: hypothetical protein AAF500_21630 [Myxococcota bacterium]